eukprot:2908328-Rhodomonas_salina.1
MKGAGRLAFRGRIPEIDSVSRDFAFSDAVRVRSFPAAPKSRVFSQMGPDLDGNTLASLTLGPNR